MPEVALEPDAKEVAQIFARRNLSEALDRDWIFDDWRRTHKRHKMRAVRDD